MFRSVCYCLLLLACSNARLAGQQHDDSLARSINLLQELVEAENYEYAQLEADRMRLYLQRNQLLCPPEAVPVLSKIYFNNEDRKSAQAFFHAATDDARRDPDPQAQVLLLDALIQAYSNWGAYEEALACQKLLLSAKDSIAASERIAAIDLLNQKVDSLSQRRQSEADAQAQFLHLDRQYVLYFGIGVGVLIFFLIFLNWRNSQRWQRRMARKILENEFLRSERYTSTLPEEPAIAPVPEPEVKAFEHFDRLAPEHRHLDKTALLIEPNRQIVLYLKSLLADRFEVETADTPTEGLQMASGNLPDLIVCDSVLNGKTGIDVIREIKLSERTNHIPVILLTDKFGNEGKLDALRAGADAWFNRPVLDRVFENQITSLLEAQKQKHEEFARFLHLYFSENRMALMDSFLLKVVQIVDQNLSDPDFLADELARKMQMHKTHFTKKLQVLTGKEPIQLIRELRLEKAKALLEKRAGAPPAIAELVGFSSSGSFALAFKEYFGENTMLLQRPD